MEDSYREMAEARFVGQEGCAHWEVLSVTSIIVSAQVLRRARTQSRYQAAEFVYDTVFYPLLMIAAVQLPPAVVLSFGVLSLAYLYLSPFKRVAFNEEPLGAFIPLLVPFRALLMMLTIYCILAVDFKIFPKSYMKTEKYGMSLMDLGVGAFVFSHGLSMGNLTANVDRLLKKWFRTSLPLALLGVSRVVLVKALNYQEHVSEYGVHWNFFFTLALLPVLYYPVKGLKTYAVVLSALHQVWLVYGGSLYILSDEREGLVGQNKEGIFSLPGYLSLFIFGCIYRRELETSLRRRVGYVVLAFVGYLVCHLLVEETSRRLCNTSYVLFVVFACSLTLLILDCLQDPCGGSEYLKALSSRSLYVFLVANLLTGLVNLSIHTLEVGTLPSYALLFVYLVASPLLGSRAVG